MAERGRVVGSINYMAFPLHDGPLGNGNKGMAWSPFKRNRMGGGGLLTVTRVHGASD